MKRLSTIVAALLGIGFIFYSWVFVSDAGFEISPVSGGSSLGYPDDYPIHHVNLSDSVPHYQYKRAQDSVTRLEEERDRINGGYGGTGSPSNGIGTLTFKNEPGRPKEEHYLQLEGFKYKESMTQFWLRDGKFFLLVPEWKKADSLDNKTGNFVWKPVQVRYASGSKTLLIPVSASMKNFYDVLSDLMTAITLVLIGITFVFIPACILLNIARRRAFAKFNYRGFYIIGISLLFFVILRMMMPYIFSWIYSDVIPSEIQTTPLTNTILTNLWPLLQAIAFLLAGVAFWRGYKLETLENETF